MFVFILVRKKPIKINYFLLLLPMMSTTIQQEPDLSIFPSFAFFRQSSINFASAFSNPAFIASIGDQGNFSSLIT